MNHQTHVIVIIDDKVFRIRRRLWHTYHACADNMIRDGEIFDYYSGIKPRALLNKVTELHRQLHVSLKVPSKS